MGIRLLCDKPLLGLEQSVFRPVIAGVRVYNFRGVHCSSSWLATLGAWRAILTQAILHVQGSSELARTNDRLGCVLAIGGGLSGLVTALLVGHGLITKSASGSRVVLALLQTRKQ